MKSNFSPENDAFFHHLVDKSLQGIFILQDGRLVFANKGAEIIYGYSIEEFLAFSILEVVSLVYPDDQVVVAANIQQFWNGVKSEAQVEFRVVRADGQIRVVECMMSLVHFNGRPAIQCAFIDRTNRRQAEIALEASEKRHHLISELMCDYAAAYRFTSEDGDKAQLEWVVGAFEEITGHPIPAAFSEFSLSAPVYPDDLPLFHERQQRLRAGESVATEFRIYNEQGEIRWLLSRGVPEWDEDHQRVSRIYVGVQDITNRKQTEEALREKEARLRLITDNMRDLIIHTDEKGNLRYASPSAYELWGISPEELRSWQFSEWLERVHPDDREKIKNRFASRVATSEGPAFGAFRLRPPDKNYFWYEYTVNSIRDNSGNLSGFVYVIRDVDRRMRADLALQESEGRLRQAMNVGRLGIWEWDIASDRTIWMGDMFRIYGVAPETFTGKGEDYLNFTLPEDRQKQRDNIAHSFERGLTERELLENTVDIQYQPNQFRILRPDGTICYVEGDAVAIIDEAGQPIRMIGVLHDITEQRAIEAAMQQAQKLESLGVLAGSVAHDFNNLLTGILTNASLIELKLAENQAIQPYLQTIMQTAEQAADITHQLLAYAGKGRFEITQLNLNELIQNNMKLLQATLPKNIEFSFKPEPGLPLTEGDSGQIQQVIMNLMLNAADAYNGSNGLVKLETATHSVTEDEPGKWESIGYVVQVGDYICLTVEDSGHGMDSQTLARIFDPFFTTKETGRGLGLAAVQGIIRGHHGALRVESLPGSGTTFQVLLPISRAKPAVAAVDSSAETDSGNRLILVVDDDEAIRNAIHDILDFHGYQVLGAENGLEAVKLCQRYAEEISLILMDMTMPVLSGIETIHKLQEYELPIPVILMSGYDEKEVDPQNRPVNLIGYLKKPFRVENLMGTIKVALESIHHNPTQNPRACDRPNV